MTLSRRQIAYLEELFEDYHNYPQRILNRKAVLSAHEPDENVGGGKSSFISKPQETKIIKELSDTRLQFLERVYSALTSIIEEASDDTLKVIKCKLFQNDGNNEWTTIATILGFSNKKVYNIRNKMLEKFGNKIGLCNTMDEG